VTRSSAHKRPQYTDLGKQVHRAVDRRKAFCIDCCICFLHGIGNLVANLGEIDLGFP